MVMMVGSPMITQRRWVAITVRIVSDGNALGAFEVPDGLSSGYRDDGQTVGERVSYRSDHDEGKIRLAHRSR
jgi:hypothetical protein